MPNIGDSMRPCLSGRAGTFRRGFSLVELVVTLAVVAIMAALAIPAVASLATSRRGFAARQLVRDLEFARRRAMATGLTTWVVFDAAADRYSVLVENAASPGRAGAQPLVDAATGRTMVQQLNSGDFAGVDLITAAIGAGAEVGFDFNGRPLDSTQTPLAADGVIAMTDASIRITAETGLVARN